VVPRTPPSTPGDRPAPRRARPPVRAGWLAGGLAAAAVVAAVVVGLQQLGGDEDPERQVTTIAKTDATTTPSATGRCTAPAAGTGDAGGAALPRSAPLRPDELVWPGEVSRNVDIWRVSADDGCAPVRLTTAEGDDSFPVLTPDRRTVVYTRGTDDDSELWVMAADGSGKRPLLEAVPPVCRTGMSRPAFGPEPDEFAVVCRDGSGRSGMFVLSLDGTVVREIPMRSDAFGDVTWSKDGRLAFWTNDAGKEGGRIVSLDARGGDRRELTSSAPGVDADPAFSPDGTRIAFRRWTEAKRSDIWVMDADGSNARPLTNADGSQQDPSWSPDGRRIVYKSASSLSEQPDVFVVDVATKAVTQLVDSPGFDTAPAWTDR
jgi:TolB protein